MLEIQTKHLQPDIVVVEITGRIKIGKECQQLEEAVGSLLREERKKVEELDSYLQIRSQVTWITI